ncbi:hypothetical protein [Actinoplanes utahensis]|uniref:Uncharacterized protein n=2 Tax=Actinoplanes utahensis TaxID=1869 RepID=A0A0A6UDL5_ACTUT|nr:hypothetical protein [Actinoplanes utahensis]KHD74135.1 hypothetical protein MB27_30575 [Actinoplanes utahensis]
MAADGPHERYLAVVSAAAFGLRPVVLAALHDPDPSVRAEAVRQALRLNWATAAELLADAPPVLRHLILRLLRRRPGTADTVIDLIRERHGDSEAVVLLPGCTAATVARLLPELAGAIGSWKILARRHSTAILDWVATRLATPGPPPWSAVEAPVRACVRFQPERVLDLLERHTPTILPPIDLAPLAARFPERTADLVIGGVPAGEGYTYLPDQVLRHFHKLDIDRLAALEKISFGIVRHLNPRRRAELYAAGQRDEPSRLWAELLPDELRVREARRALAQPSAAADDYETRMWRSYLPAAEVLPELDEASRDSEPYTRGNAYATMVQVAVREPAAAPEVLRRLLRLRNDRELVRLPVLRVLRELLPHLDGTAAPALTAITDAALDARDFSHRNREQLVELAYEALAGRPTGSSAASGPADGPVVEDELARWALGMIARLPIPSWVETLRPGQEHLITAALRKRITTDTGELLALVRLLETRARHVPQIQDLLRRAASPSAPADVRAEATEKWLDDPRTRAARAAELLREDPTAVRLAPVWREITTYSTDLLNAVLPGLTPSGRPDGLRPADTTPAESPAGRWAVHFAQAGPLTQIRRWVPEQQRAYAEALAVVAADTEQDQRLRVRAVKSLARVPVVGGELLAGFLDTPETPIAEAAIGALPWTDRPGDTLPALLSHAGEDSARVALPAAARAVRFVSGSALLDMLRGILLAPASSGVRVTSRKAAVRLLARYGPPESADLLAEVWRAPGAHPDVRAAVVTAVRGPAPSPLAWKIFTEAAASTEPVVVRALLAITPAELGEPQLPRFAALVAAACTSPHPPIAQEAFRHLPSWVRWAPDASELIVAALADPGFTGPARYWPVPVLSSMTRALLELPERGGFGAVLDRLATLDRNDPDGGTVDRDRPARRCLTRIVDDACRWARDLLPRDPEPFRTVARHLAADPAYLGEAAELLTALAGTDADALAEVADLVATRPALAVRLAAQADGFRWDRDQLGEILVAARRLADRADLAGGLFALTLVSTVGKSERWPDPCQETLRHLRRHPNPDVADAALHQRMEH